MTTRNAMAVENAAASGMLIAMPKRTARLSLDAAVAGPTWPVPEGTVRLAAARLVWTGTIQPTGLSRTYRVQLIISIDVAVIWALTAHGRDIEKSERMGQMSGS